MTASAESDEGSGGIIKARPAGACPPFPPFGFERMNVVARRSRSSILIGFSWQWGQHLAIRGQGGMAPGFPVEECDVVTLLVECNAVIGEVIVLRDMLHHLPETGHDAL